jgi:ABC-type branched-subunit amino acid transport system ATPase component
VKSLLSVHGLHAGYGKTRILRDITFSVGPEIVGMVGRNGVGKTTLARTLIGSLPALGGDGTLFGEKFLGRRSHARSRAGLGYVPQGARLLADLSVQENIMLGLSSKDVDRQVLEMLYQEFPRLPGLLGRRAGALSGGERAAAAFARCLVRRPRLMVLDEPTEGVQPNLIQAMSRVLRAYAEQAGAGVLLIEQDLDMVAGLAGRCLIVDQGRIVDEVAPEGLLVEENRRQILAL